MKNRFLLTRRSLLAASALAALQPAFAQQAKYPSRTVRWIIGYPPGGGSDTIARIVATALSSVAGQTVVVDNKPGASANIAGHELTRSAPDGHTVMTADNGLLVFNPVMYKKMGFSPSKEMKPAGLLARLHLLIAVPPNHPANNYRELVAWIKEQKNGVQYAASSVGSPLHLAMARLAAESKLNLTHVPYKGAAPAIQDFLSGQVQLICNDYSSAAPHVKAGKMKVLAVISGKRISALPNVPTVSEAGGPANFEAYAWQGMVMPAATPDTLISQFNELLNRALSQKEVVDKLNELGVEATPSTPAQMASFWSKESDIWQPLIRQLDISMD
jgi:tripartite-type tricarboxylate transporter receptor subunit TctC